MENIQGIDYAIMSSVFALTLASPLLCLILVFFTRQIFSTYESIPIGAVILTAISIMGISVKQELVQQSNISGANLTIWFPRILSLIFLTLLPISSIFLASIKKLEMLLWKRIVLCFALIITIPMGFTPLGIWIDGYQGFGSTIGYQSEFTFRMINLLTFNFLSHFDRGGFSIVVEHASNQSVSAYIFDLLVSTFSLSTIFALLLKRKQSQSIG